MFDQWYKGLPDWMLNPDYRGNKAAPKGRGTPKRPPPLRGRREPAALDRRDQWYKGLPDWMLNPDYRGNKAARNPGPPPHGVRKPNTPDHWLINEKPYKRQPLPHGEGELARYPVIVRRSRLGGASAELIITDRHLILNPLNMDSAKMMLRLMGGLSVPGMGLLASSYERTELPETRMIHAEDIWAADAIEGRLPGIKVTFSNGTTVDLMIAHRMVSAAWDKRNREARDNALRHLHFMQRPPRW